MRHGRHAHGEPGARAGMEKLPGGALPMATAYLKSQPSDALET